MSACCTHPLLLCSHLCLCSLFASLQRGAKTLIFTQFTEALDILEVVLDNARYGWSRLDGQTDVSKRQAIINAFSSNPSLAVMLLSTRAGGVGINLTCANTVVFLDQDWNVQMMRQAEDRAHRIGQTKPVHVHRLLCAGTIEHHMASVADDKGVMSEALLHQSEQRAGSKAAAVTQVAMQAMVDNLGV